MIAKIIPIHTFIVFPINPTLFFLLSVILKRWNHHPSLPNCLPLLSYLQVQKRTTIPARAERGHPKNGAQWRSTYNYNLAVAAVLSDPEGLQKLEKERKEEPVFSRL